MKNLVGVASAFLALTPIAAAASPRLGLTIVSSRPDTVSGDDALLALSLPDGANAADAVIKLDSTDVTTQFKLKDGRLIGLVSGLKPGANMVTATVHGRTSKLKLINHSRNGPIFSGPQQQPFICETDRIKLPDGSSLGPAQDASCNAPTKIMYVYRPTTGKGFKPMPADGKLPADLATTTTIDGKTVNYILRVEVGTINRAIYQFAVLFDPTRDEAPSPTASYAGWNGRVVYAFGGGASAGYRQGVIVGDGLDDDVLSRGFAQLNSSLNVMGTVGSDVVAAETASMVKEKFIETFGPVKHTMGWGGSGGSMQQHLIANNYPGILDGITPSSSFPDLYTLVPYAVDCPLMMKAMKAGKVKWTEEEKRAASGLNTFATCVQWEQFFTPEWMWARNCYPLIPKDQVYDRQRNPEGTRCTIFAAARNSLGFDPKTGQTYQGYDNVGIQYGWKAYRAGAISAEQFVELNELAGGYDRDGDFQTGRTAADPLALRRMYEYGRINQGSNLDDLPVLDLRGNPGRLPNVHDAIKTESMRARLVRSNGTRANHVIIRSGGGDSTAPGSGAVSPYAQMNIYGLVELDKWLTNMEADTRTYPTRMAKMLANKPEGLKEDSCFMPNGTFLFEPSSIANQGKCGSAFPYFDDPRIASGAPLANDILKCQLRPFRAADYPGMAPELIARLKAVFSTGVCDWSKRSVGYRPLKGTWLSYPRPGVAVPIAQTAK